MLCPSWLCWDRAVGPLASLQQMMERFLWSFQWDLAWRMLSVGIQVRRGQGSEVQT